MAIDATIGGADSNSYVTIVEADTYFKSHWSTTKMDLWLAMASKQKERLLMMSTNIIETLRFLDKNVGGGGLPEPFVDMMDSDVMVRKFYYGQRLSFPRNIDVTLEGDGEIPIPVKDAQCEQSVYLITFDEGTLATQYQGIVEESVVAGSVRAYANYGRLGTMLSPVAAELLRPYLRPTRRFKRS